MKINIKLSENNKTVFRIILATLVCAPVFLTLSVGIKYITTVIRVDEIINGIITGIGIGVVIFCFSVMTALTGKAIIDKE